MAETRKNILSQITPGNIITIGIVVVGAITAWARIQVHLQDDALHINEGEVVLTMDEYKSLIRTVQSIEDEFPVISSNQNRVTELEKENAVHYSQYLNLYNEQEDLESKVSRIYKELKDEINEIDH